MKADKRIVERLHIKTDKWHRVKMINLKKGDVFRMSDPDGTKFQIKGETVFVAAANAYITKNGEVGVTVNT